MKVSNMTGRTGKPIANQFIISEEGHGANGNFKLREYFQSYESVIVDRIIWGAKDAYTTKDKVEIKLDSKYWNYSATTSKYRNQFLNETTAETKHKIETGEYILTNLN